MIQVTLTQTDLVDIIALLDDLAPIPGRLSGVLRRPLHNGDLYDIAVEYDSSTGEYQVTNIAKVTV